MHLAAKTLAIVIFLFSFVQIVYSHGTGASFEKETGDYLIDIGYEPEEFVSGQETTFSFSLLNPKSGEQVEYDDIWVRIEKKKQTIFAAGITHGINNSPTMIFTFPQEGDYMLHTRFQKENEPIVEASFPIKVVKNEEDMETNGSLPLIPIGGGVILGLVLGFGSQVFLKKKSS